ncbi:MAG: hypothetical protein HY646_19535, partial [Acidobacteria bacterium]|nr:hypothetical protein [Acidobacteriota bacterium]
RRGPEEFPIYNSWVPRVAMVYDLTGEGRVALKASYGRYTGSDSGTGWLPGAAAGNINPASTTAWTYRWNGMIPFVPSFGPDGIFGNSDDPELLSVSGGGGQITETLDKNLKSEYTDEYTVGLDLGFSRDYTFRFNAVRKMDYRSSMTINPFLPFEAYTDLVMATDPGRDNTVGTPDDARIPIYSVPRSHPYFGTDFQHTIQAPSGSGNNLFTGLEFTFNKRFSDGWSLMFSYSPDFRKVRDTIPQTPNDLLHEDSQQFSEWHGALKIAGVYQLPLGLQYSTSFIAQSQDYYNREIQVRNALGNRVTLDIERQFGRLEWVKIWDQRFTKMFPINDQHTIDVTFDLFNSLNANTVTEVRERMGSDFLRPEEILSPRIFRLGARWRF